MSAAGFGVDTFITDDTMQPDELARAIEERGLDSLLLAEHTHIPVRRETPWGGGPELPPFYHRTYDPFVALSAAAAATSRITLGTAIALAAQRDAILLAKQVATLDRISRGRVLLGVGAGWNREEARNHGVPPSARGAVLDEKLAAIAKIWTRDEAEFHGSYVDFDPIHCWPKPVQQPHPPIYIGGESRVAVRRVLEHGDGWMPRARTTPEVIRHTLAWLDDRGKAARLVVCGVPPDLRQVEQFLAIGPDHITFSLAPSMQAPGEGLRQLDRIAELASVLR